MSDDDAEQDVDESDAASSARSRQRGAPDRDHMASPQAAVKAAAEACVLAVNDPLRWRVKPFLDSAAMVKGLAAYDVPSVGMKSFLDSAAMVKALAAYDVPSVGMKSFLDSAAMFRGVTGFNDSNILTHTFAGSTTGVSALSRSVMGTYLSPSIVEFIKGWGRDTKLDLFDKVNERVEKARRALLRRSTLPSNLHEIEDITTDDVLNFTQQHGISLYLSAPAQVASALLDAKDSQGVRQVLGDRRTVILRHCKAMLGRCSAPSTADYRKAAEQAVAALELDLFYPAQATAGSLVETLHKQAVDPVLRSASRRKRSDTPMTMRARIADHEVWGGYIATALWTSFTQYRIEDNDPVPRTFSRHATAHALGSKQFSRRSAVQGIMLVTSVIAYLNDLC